MAMKLLRRGTHDEVITAHCFHEMTRKEMLRTLRSSSNNDMADRLDLEGVGKLIQNLYCKSRPEAGLRTFSCSPTILALLSKGGI
jgi:hypothetical protein